MTAPPLGSTPTTTKANNRFERAVFVSFFCPPLENPPPPASQTPSSLKEQKEKGQREIVCIQRKCRDSNRFGKAKQTKRALTFLPYAEAGLGIGHVSRAFIGPSVEVTSVSANGRSGNRVGPGRAATLRQNYFDESLNFQRP